MNVSLEPFALPERYRLEGGIAAGGMAAVYAAHDTVLDRPVAVKVLADHLNDDPTARARFEREARAAAALSNHAGVVTIFDVGDFGGRAFIVMERRDGGTVAQAGRVDRPRALAWLRTVAEALDAAHEGGIVHRDIKPGNLLLDERGAVAVADFGIASLVDDTERFTQTGQVLGTAAYLSPEQAAGEAATPASDRYSLAVVAYELLAGEKPFETGSNFAAAARAHIEDPPPDAPGLPREVRAVLKRGLAKDPRERWPTATAFVEALATAFDAGSEPVAERTLPLPPRRPADRRRRTGTLLVALAAALVVAAGVALVLDGGGPERQAAGGSQPRPEPTSEAAPEREREATPEPTAAATEPPAETPAAEPQEAAPETTGDPSALNNEGFALFQSEDYASAVPLFQQAVEACGESTDMDPCGFALYNLGASLNRSGDPAAAIPVLEDRLARFGDNESKDVKTELKSARKNAR